MHDDVALALLLLQGGVAEVFQVAGSSGWQLDFSGPMVVRVDIPTPLPSRQTIISTAPDGPGATGCGLDEGPLRSTGCSSVFGASSRLIHTYALEGIQRKILVEQQFGSRASYTLGSGTSSRESAQDHCPPASHPPPLLPLLLDFTFKKSARQLTTNKKL